MQKISLSEYKTLLPYFKKYRFSYLAGFLCLVVVDGAQVIIPQFVRRAVDLLSGGGFLWLDVVRLCLLMLGTMVFVALGRFFWRFFIHGASRRIETEMRDGLFTHLLSLSYDFYQKNKIGDLMARSINDIGAVRNAMSWGLVTLVDGTMLAAAILVIIFVQDAHTAVLAVAPLPLITLVILFFGKAMGKRFHRAQETYSAMSDVVQETFAGIRVIKSFVKEWWFNKKFAAGNDDYRDANMNLVKLFGIFFPFVSFLAGLTTIILLFAGGRRVVMGQLSPGGLVALFTYFQMLIWPLMGAGFMVNMIQRGAASMARINEVMNSRPLICEPDNPELPRPGCFPAVELRNLSFGYPPEVLKGISLKVEEGTVLGILGRTGQGKSTLLKTLVRMVDPPPETVFVRGLDVRRWDLAELRRNFGMSPQDSYLFSDTIKSNIAYGQSSAESEEPQLASLTRAALLSALDRDLEDFALGWDTLIGERGLTLSGGQKQRVAIARAVMASPEILVLDDSFSAVDAETERRILTGILDDRRNNGKTTIIVSHRVSTLNSADKVLVLDEGRISEYGTPEELLEKKQFFAKMAELQRLGEGSAAGEADHV